MNLVVLPDRSNLFRRWMLKYRPNSCDSLMHRQKQQFLYKKCRIDVYIFYLFVIIKVYGSQRATTTAAAATVGVVDTLSEYAIKHD
jgi:hypothetical protein